MLLYDTKSLVFILNHLDFQCFNKCKLMSCMVLNFKKLTKLYLSYF